MTWQLDATALSALLDAREITPLQLPAKQPSMRAASCEGCGKGAAADKGRLWSRGAHQCLPYRQQFR